MCQNFTKSISSVLGEITSCASVSLDEKSATIVDSKKTQRRPFTVLVEGNIGSGKSTFLDHFKQIPEVERIPEPVDRWRDAGGFNLLQMMYEDPARWSLTFQTFVQLTMVENHTKNTNKSVKIMERSLYSAKYCFVENLVKSGKMPRSEYEVLAAWFNYLMSSPGMDLGVDLIVYMRTDPGVAMDRVQGRKRGEEHLIPLQYLEDLHNLHEEWLVEQKFPLPAPVIVVDANKDLSSMKSEFNRQQELIFGELKENRAGKEPSEKGDKDMHCGKDNLNSDEGSNDRPLKRRKSDDDERGVKRETLVSVNRN